MGDPSYGLWQLQLETGCLADRGWGPWRPWIETWRWNGEAFVRARVQEAESDLLAFRVVDGHRAQMDGDLDRAEALFRAAATNPCLRASEWIFTAEEEAANLQAFSYFRLVVIALSQGEVGKASYYLRALKSEHPGHEFLALAELFWEGGGVAGKIGRARRAVEAYARGRPELLTLLNFGYENPGFKVEDLCGSR
jgi:hypothetical protein